MYKDSCYKKIIVRRGFTLIEVQVYLTITMIMVVMITHVVLVYKNLYDNTFIMAQKSILLLAAMRKINELCDKRVLQKEGAQGFSLPLQVHKKSLMYADTRSTIVLLEEVDTFSFKLDKRNSHLIGITCSITHRHKVFTWYHAFVAGVLAC